ncbi:hypothetical protein ACX4ZB_06730 [Aerococcus urinae]
MIDIVESFDGVRYLFLGGIFIKEVRNGADKKVCMLDQNKKIVEIQSKGFVTTIRFSKDGKVIIEDKPIK